MKAKSCYLLAFLLLVAHFDAIGQTQVTENIYTNTTWSAAGSPYNLAGGISIIGCVLTIQAGTTVNMANGWIYAITTDSYVGPARTQINATNVTFIDGGLYFWGENRNGIDYYSGGTLTNCTFQRSTVQMTDFSNPSITGSTMSLTNFTGTAIDGGGGHCSPTITHNTITNTSNTGIAIALGGALSTPTISNNVISGFELPIQLKDGTVPTIAGNTVTGCRYQSIGLAGTFSNNYTLPDFGYPYRLTGSITLIGATFTITSGLTINALGNWIYAITTDSYVGPARTQINATNVTFIDGGLYFWGENRNGIDYYSGGTLTNCTFQRSTVQMTDFSNPSITGSTMSLTNFTGTAIDGGGGHCSPTITHNTITNTSNTGIAIALGGALSTPTISNNVISGFELPIQLKDGTVPTIAGNTVTGCRYQSIGLAGTFSNNYTLPDFGYPYRLTGSITLIGATFTITSGLTINALGNWIYAITTDSYVGPARTQINATNVTFIDGGLYFWGENRNGIDYYSGGTLTNCTFQRSTVQATDFSNPSFSNAVFTETPNAISISGNGRVTVDHSDFLLIGEYGILNEGINNVDAKNNFWGDASGPYNANTNITGTGCKVSSGITFRPFSTTSLNSNVLLS